MSATEVTTLLNAWAGRLRDLGAGSVDHLCPGLSRADVDATADEFGVRLADDAAAVWMWHDGDRETHEQDFERPSVFPHGLFLSLRGSLERSLWLQRITCDGDDDGDYSDEDPGQELYFRRSFAILVDRQSPTYLDCSDPDQPATATGIFESHDIIRTPRLALVERLRLWHRALDLGVWPAGPAEQWATDDTRAAQAVPELPQWWLVLD